MKKKLFKSFALAVLSVICTMMFSGCFLTMFIIDEVVNDTSKALTVDGGMTVSCVYNEEYQMYDVAVDGVVKNISEDDWTWVHVTLVLYDADNNVVGSANTYTELILTNGSWRFCAKGTTMYEVTSAQLHEITGTREL